MVNVITSVIDNADGIMLITWRKRIGDLVLLVGENDKALKMISLEDFKITDLFDSIEISVDIEDWVDVKKLKKGIINKISGL